MGPDSTLSDEELAVCAKAGDGGAFEELFEGLYGPTHAICRRILGDIEDANDAATETFVRAYVSIASCTYKPERVRRFRSWLFRIATNTCYDELRKRGRTPPVVSIEETTAAGEQPGYEWVDSSVRWDPEAISDWHPVGEAYDGLDPAKRVVLAKRFFGEQTWQEVADDMGLTYAQARYLGVNAAQDFAEELARRGITFDC
jgi:RNA polymerase sigma factor (sigma-70 family)